jgi:hypothetical protein
MVNKEKEILNKLDSEEIIALAYGFPLMSEKYYGSNNNLTSMGTGNSMNGTQKLDVINSFDGFDFRDEEFDNFLTKKGRERNKAKKELRDSGLSRKDARKQALEDIPRDNLKTVAKNIGRGVGRAIVVGAVQIPRSAFLSLVAINFRGLAYKLSAIIEQKQGNSPSSLDALKKKWDKLGGKFDALVKSTNKGKDKKPSICGKKCKLELINSGSNSISAVQEDFDSFNDGLDFESNYFSFVEQPVLLAWIGASGAILGALGAIINTAVTSKTEKEAIKSADRQAELEAKTMSESDQKAYEIEMKKLALKTDPKTLILNNNELSAPEKREAIKLLEEVEGSGSTPKLQKYVLYGVLAIVGIFVFSKIVRKKQII